jgi:cytoskeletal protein RodZ
VKNQQNTKEKESSLAFASLMEEVEKSRKKAKIFYISGLVLVVLAVFSFLLFGPVTVPVFSELGDKILNKTEVVEEQELEEDTPEVAEKEEEPEEEVEEPEKVVEKEVATTTPTKTTTPKPTPEPTYLCTDAEIQELKDGIAQLKGYKEETQAQIDQLFFECFDYGLENYPNQSDEFYQDVCAETVCVDGLCDLPYEFQQGIDDFQADLDNCLSDR